MRINFSLLLLFVLGFSTLQAQEEGFEFVNPPMTIVVLGSSTAEGIGTSPRSNAWVNQYREYVQTFNPNNEVINLGKGGFGTYRILPTGSVNSFKRALPDTTRNITKALQSKPYGIIINLPSNDVASGYSVAEQLANFRKYAEVAKTNNIDLWVTTTQPRNFTKDSDRQLQSDLKDSLIALFPNHYIDFWNGFSDENFRLLEPLDSGDGCHMNNEGHKLLTDRVIESQAFIKKLHATSFQRSTADKLPEELARYLLGIGFKGKIDLDSTREYVPRYVKIKQQDRTIDAVEVNPVSLEYTIETIIDLRYPVEVVFEAPKSLTKVVEFEFDQLVKDEFTPKVYYPVEDLSMLEVPLEELNYTFEAAKFTIAEFHYDSTRLGVELDNQLLAQQRVRIADAKIKPPAEGAGKMVDYWENGNKKSILKYKNGQLNGRAFWFNEEGNLERVVFFKNGAYHGKYVKYNNGKKASQQVYKNDLRIGKTKTYN